MRSRKIEDLCKITELVSGRLNPESQIVSNYKFFSFLTYQENQGSCIRGLEVDRELSFPLNTNLRQHLATSAWLHLTKKIQGHQLATGLRLCNALIHYCYYHPFMVTGYHLLTSSQCKILCVILHLPFAENLHGYGPCVI